MEFWSGDLQLDLLLKAETANRSGHIVQCFIPEQTTETA